MFKTIAIDKLVPSSRNVRRTTNEAADAQLAADIAARGLLQNLVVTPLTKPRGRYAVEAGGRRLRALQTLREAGTLPGDHEVTCLVLARDNASSIEASLAENIQRLAMNPADECLAFRALIEAGTDVAGIARRFGLTVRFVEGRLRLAGLAPVVFDALGAGEITLDAAQAYAATSDQERQAYVFEQLAASWGGAHPDSIRRMMVHATVPGRDRRARYVGDAAYLAAGGRIEGDLFDDDGEARWLDVALLERLAAEKLEVEAAWQQRQYGYGFVRATLDAYVSAWQHDDLRRISIPSQPLTEGEAAEIAQLEERIEALAATLEDDGVDNDARVAAEAQIEKLSDAQRAIADKPPLIDPALQATTGVFLLIDDRGRPRLDRTVYQLVDDEAGEEANTADGSTGAVATGTNSSASGSVGDAAKAAPRLPQRLLDELAMQRRDILAAHVAADPAFARDLAVFLMADRASAMHWERTGSTLSASRPSDPVSGFATPEAVATRALEEASEALDRTWCAIDAIAERFDAFRALDTSSRDAWLACCVALTLEASLSGHRGGRACSFHDHLGTLLQIDIATEWRPTGSNWFDRVPKALTLETLEAVGGATLAARHAKDKKADLAEACEHLFAGEGIIEAEVRTAALAWVPDEMRFVAAEPAPPWVHGEEDDPVNDDACQEAAEDDLAGERPDALDGRDDARDAGPIDEGSASPDGEAPDTANRPEVVEQTA